MSHSATGQTTIANLHELGDKQAQLNRAQWLVDYYYYAWEMGYRDVKELRAIIHEQAKVIEALRKALADRERGLYFGEPANDK